MANSIPEDSQEFTPNIERREAIGKIFEYIFLLGLLIGLFVLALLIFDIGKDGLARFLTPGFLTETPSRFPDKGGILPAIVSSLLLGLIVILVAVPIGVGAALYLEEYAPKTWWSDLIEINISNLAGVPSIVYGLLGLGVFNYLLGFG